MGLLKVFMAFALYQSWTTSSMPFATESQGGPIAGLCLTLAHSSGSADPWAIDATIANNNDHPVTILSYNSPLDPLAVKLGLFKITPEGADKPINYPTIAVRRAWPPPKDALVTIQPGKTHSGTFSLKDVPGFSSWDWNQFTVIMKGKWDGVWSVTSDDVSPESLDDPTNSPQVQQGDFVSKPLILVGKKKQDREL